jgi:hypothetical protein
MSEYLRLQITQGIVARVHPVDTKAVISQISRVGNNLNQIAHKMNAGGVYGEQDFYILKHGYEQLLRYYTECVMGKKARKVRAVKLGIHRDSSDYGNAQPSV